jgi:hypothetical protein
MYRLHGYLLAPARFAREPSPRFILVVHPTVAVPVGDRLLTDVVFANHHGMVSVLVAPLSYTKDHPVAAVLRCVGLCVQYRPRRSPQFFIIGYWSVW